MNLNTQQENNSPVTLINVFEVPTGHVDAFIARWRERAALMSTKPGFLDSRLHRALSSQTRFQLVNVAHWESREAYRAATADTEFQDQIRAAVADSEVPISSYPALYLVAVEFTYPVGDEHHHISNPADLAPS
jgi:heme-degrading monooxygenase HmoA